MGAGAEVGAHVGPPPPELEPDPEPESTAPELDELEPDPELDAIPELEVDPGPVNPELAPELVEAELDPDPPELDPAAASDPASEEVDPEGEDEPLSSKPGFSALFEHAPNAVRLAARVESKPLLEIFTNIATSPCAHALAAKLADKERRATCRSFVAAAVER